MYCKSYCFSDKLDFFSKFSRATQKQSASHRLVTAGLDHDQGVGTCFIGKILLEVDFFRNYSTVEGLEKRQINKCYQSFFVRMVVLFQQRRVLISHCDPESIGGEAKLGGFVE